MYSISLIMRALRNICLYQFKTKVLILMQNALELFNHLPHCFFFIHSILSFLATLLFLTPSAYIHFNNGSLPLAFSSPQKLCVFLPFTPFPYSGVSLLKPFHLSQPSYLEHDTISFHSTLPLSCLLRFIATLHITQKYTLLAFYPKDLEKVHGTRNERHEFISDLKIVVQIFLTCTWQIHTHNMH